MNILTLSMLSVFNSIIVILIDSQIKSSVLARSLIASLSRSAFTIFSVNVISYLICCYASNIGDWLGLVFLVYFGFTIFLLGIVRIILHAVYTRRKRTIAVVGTKAEVDWFAKKFLIRNKRDKNLKYLLYEEGMEKDVSSVYANLNMCDDVYLTSNLKEINKSLILMYCAAKKDISVHIVPQIYEIGVISSSPTQVDDVLALEISGFHLSFMQRFIKRIFDIFCSVVGLLVFWPLMAIAAIVIKCQDGGYPIFKQERLTLKGKKFILYKFRTMIINAEKTTGAVLASTDDERITKFGKLIRMTRIDELPQLWNVLKGEMSFVGPRPERVEFVQDFLKKTPAYRYRMNVKAGIAGLAQVRGNYATDYRDKLRWDLLYIKNYSILLDIKIILWTLQAVFNRNSARGRKHENLSLAEFFAKFDLSLHEIDSGFIIENANNIKTSDNKSKNEEKSEVGV